MATLSYSHEKFEKAVRLLATHPGSIRERLHAAWIEAAMATPDPIEGAARAEYDKLNALWKAHSDGNPKGGNGIGHFLDTLDDKQCIEQAKLLLMLEYETRS